MVWRQAILCLYVWYNVRYNFSTKLFYQIKYQYSKIQAKCWEMNEAIREGKQVRKQNTSDMA